VSWARLEAEAPELARLCRARLEVPGVALLGTLRPDGSPRIDPVEPCFAKGDLLLGAMRRSAKAAGLRRDPRCVLHSTVSGPNTGEPDVKLSGRVEPSDVLAGWWADRPGDAAVYVLVIAEAVVVEWDLAASRMRIHRWTAERGATVSQRGYP
jgi:Pyridoxamine 5'-phosphate oxidase